MLEWIVTGDETGLKLSTFLMNRLEKKYSARLIKKMIEQNRCEINGRTQRFASTIMERGDYICLHMEQPLLASSDQFEQRRLIYEDDALLVYNKPAAMNCDEKGILSLFKSYTPHIQLVHRLDRDTTGVLLLAKQSNIFDLLVKQFKEFQIEKRYQAIVDGIIYQPKGVIENYLAKKKAFAGQTFWGSVSPSKGLYAYTEWQRLKLGKKVSLLACYPKTGRTHQIRVHMAEMGHPILGDFQYGKQFQSLYRPSRCLLHAEVVRLKHPVTGEPLCLTAPLPDDFKLVLQKLFKT